MQKPCGLSNPRSKQLSCITTPPWAVLSCETCQFYWFFYLWDIVENNIPPPHDETLAANRELEMVEKASQKAVARKPKNYSSFFFIISLPWFESAVSRPQREERLGYQESIQLPAKRPYAKNRNRGPGFLFRVEIRSAQNPDHSKNSENGQWNQGHYWTQRNTKTK